MKTLASAFICFALRHVAKGETSFCCFTSAVYINLYSLRNIIEEPFHAWVDAWASVLEQVKLNPREGELLSTRQSLSQPFADSTASNSTRSVSIQDSCRDSNFEPLLCSIYCRTCQVFTLVKVRVRFGLSYYVLQINNCQLLYGL